MKNIFLGLLLLISTVSIAQQNIGTADNINFVPGTLKVGSYIGSYLGGGTTAQRGAGYGGLMRWNSDSLKYEFYNGSLWSAFGSSGGGTPGGSTTQIQYNSSGSFAGSANLIWDNTNTRLGVGVTPSNALHVYATGAADGISIDGTNSPSLILRSSGTIKAYAPALVTGLDGFFLNTVSGDLAFRSEANKIHFGVTGGNIPSMTIGSSKQVGFGVTSPTAAIHIRAGTASAGTAPLKLTSGVNLTTPESGAMEFDGTHYYGTVGTTRFQLDQQSAGSTPGGSTTQIQYNNAGTFAGNAALVWDNTNARMGVGIAAPTNALHVYTTGVADGIAIDGTTYPSLVLKISGVTKGYAPAIVSQTAGFFLTTQTGDMAFRTEVAGRKFFFGNASSTTQGATIGVEGVNAAKYYVSALNTAPVSATDTGTLGEIRVTAGFIYVCSATNTWVRTALITF